MKILRHYVLREHAGPFFFALATLTSLFLLNQVARHFGDLVGKGLGGAVIGEFFALSIPFIIAMTTPMAVLIATLYAFSRLAAENEITALRASGVGMTRILLPVIFAGAFFAMLMVAFNDQVLPRTNHRLRKLQTDIARKKPTFALREQVINEVSPGKLFLRTMKIDEADDLMRDVMIIDLSDPLRRRTIHADSGRMGMSKNMSDLELTLYDGYSQEIPKEEPGKLQRLFFNVDFIRVRGVADTLQRTEEDAYKSDREMSVCEMQEQVSQASREYETARFHMEEALAASARRAATGEPPHPTAAPESLESQEPFGLGRLYCDAVAAITRLVQPDSAMAAQQVPQLDSVVRTPGARRPAQQTARRRPDSVVVETAGVTDRRRRDAERRRSLGIAPSAGLPPSAENFSSATLHLGPGEPLDPFIGQLELMSARMRDSRQVMNRYDVEIQKKFALAFACIVFVMIGAPIALRFPRGGVGLVIGASVGIFALYYIGLVGGEALADRLIMGPFLAMWLTNLLFLGIAALLLSRMGKEGVTARGGDMSEAWDALRAWFARQARRVGIPLERRRRR
ncbi:MAG TPA: LptF/LptG family permease [Gemmatimonadaceae bacterium]|nr:LptF/LptG family permease [Gemmatimonadaceae bacterium]